VDGPQPLVQQRRPLRRSPLCSGNRFCPVETSCLARLVSSTSTSTSTSTSMVDGARSQLPVTPSSQCWCGGAVWGSGACLGPQNGKTWAALGSVLCALCSVLRALGLGRPCWLPSWLPGSGRMGMGGHWPLLPAVLARAQSHQAKMPLSCPMP
jgi:hypothetical protein